MAQWAIGLTPRSNLNMRFILAKLFFPFFSVNLPQTRTQKKPLYSTSNAISYSPVPAHNQRSRSLASTANCPHHPHAIIIRIIVTTRPFNFNILTKTFLSFPSTVFFSQGNARRFIPFKLKKIK